MTAAPPVPILAGPRLRLRALAERDVDALFALHSDERVMRYWSFPAWTERRQAVEHIARLARERAVAESYAWVATLHGEDRAVGTCSLYAIRRERARGVVGYSLAPALWGRGLGAEMLGLALDFAFGALRLRRIEADVDARNLASCRLAERAGFVRERVLCERARGDGSLRQTALYALRRRDYAAASNG